MKKLLLLGGSHAEIPLIRAAKRLGYYVITSGNQIDGMGHPYADEYCMCDFSDKEAVLALAKEKRVDAICSGCNDFAALTTAYVCEKLGLSGHDSYETACRIHHKDRYRLLAEKLGIKTPKAERCLTKQEMLKASESMQFPLIVKPVDLTGGKGMQRCDMPGQIESAFARAMEMTREEHVLIEEFVEGTNHGFSAYIRDEKVSFYFVDNEQYYKNPYLVSGASAPGDVPEAAIRQLCEDCEKLSSYLKLVDGILHIQFILKDDGMPVIIEVCRRAPGDLYIELVRLATGLDYPYYLVAAEAGIRLDVPVFHEADGYYVRHCVMADAAGSIGSVEIAEEIRPYLVSELFWYREGDLVEDVMKYKAGIIFLHFQTEKEYRQYLPQLTELIRIRLL
ncbi:MAG: ATP-grasp domain-containing protein [Lachnospiraceae bacterium]|nr:ATP-grasp domain-containing protein [Lachnospiraceae bacterium]